MDEVTSDDWTWNVSGVTCHVCGRSVTAGNLARHRRTHSLDPTAIHE